MRRTAGPQPPLAPAKNRQQGQEGDARADMKTTEAAGDPRFTVVVADNSSPFVRALRALLATLPGGGLVVHTVTSIESAAEWLGATDKACDLLVIGNGLPVSACAGLVATALRRVPTCHVVVFLDEADSIKRSCLAAQGVHAVFGTRDAFDFFTYVRTLVAARQPTPPALS